MKSKLIFRKNQKRVTPRLSKINGRRQLKTKRPSESAGLSLLGLLIAIFITTTGLIAILSLSNLTLKGGTPSEMKLIASGLAQEGVEIVRDIRKSYPEWNDWYSGVIGGDYLVQYDSAVLLPYSEIPLELNVGSGLYQYSAGQNTPFYRKITLVKISSVEVKVTAEVKWRTGGNWHYLTAEDRLWNWK